MGGQHFPGLPMCETMPIDDVFVSSIGKIENLGCVVRFWLCLPESAADDPSGPSINVVKTRLLIPRDMVIPMARQAMCYTTPDIDFGSPPYVS